MTEPARELMVAGELGGRPPGLLWLAVHLFGLTGFKNRVALLSHWSIAFLSRGYPQPAIAAQQVFGRQVSEAQSAIISGGSGAFDVPWRG